MSSERNINARSSVAATTGKRWSHYVVVALLIAISQVMLPIGAEWAMFGPIRIWHVLLIRAFYAVVVLVIADIGLASILAADRKASKRMPIPLGIFLIIAMVVPATGFAYLASQNEGPVRRIFIVMSVKAVVIMGIAAWHMFFCEPTERETN